MKLFDASTNASDVNEETLVSSEGKSLLLENQRKGLSVVVPKGGLSVFHAGIIGKGPRQGMKQENTQKVLLDQRWMLKDKYSPPS